MLLKFLHGCIEWYFAGLKIIGEANFDVGWSRSLKLPISQSLGKQRNFEGDFSRRDFINQHCCRQSPLNWSGKMIPITWIGTKIEITYQDWLSNFVNYFAEGEAVFLEISFNTLWCSDT